MRLSFILVSVFVTVFNLVGSSPYRERHVLNRVPVTIEKTTWAENKDSKKHNYDENNNDVQKDDDNAGARIVNAIQSKAGNTEKEDDGEMSANNNNEEGNVEKVKPISLIKDIGNEKLYNQNQAASRPIPPTPTTLLRDDADVSKKVIKDYQGAPKPKPIKLLKSNAGASKKVIKDKQAVIEIRPISLLRDEKPVNEKENNANPAKPITLLEDIGDEKGVIEDQSNTDDRNTESGDSNDEQGDGDENIPSEKDQNDEDDGAAAGSDNTQDTEGKHPIKEQQAEAFQKYHAERFSDMQGAMANNWPLGIIPYKFDTSSFDNILALRVRDAMDFLEGVSCVQFKALTGRIPDNYSWIHITNPEKERECSHKTKKKSSGEIVLTLGLECLKRRDILHSLLHAIGFKDEVTHPHRDQYIRIMWENVQPKYQNLFALLPGDRKVLVEYDPMSIMHFHDRAYSRNGQATIVPLIPGLQIQPSEMLSQLDTVKLRIAFGRECNRQAADNLLDTCKNVMHKESRMVKSGNPQRMTLEDGGRKDNIAENKNVEDNKEKNEKIVRDDYQYEDYDMPGLQIQPSDKLSQLDKMRLRLAFGHECNRRTVDDLLDTCKNVMHKSKGEDDEESLDRLKSKKKEEQLTNKLKPLSKKNKDANEHTDTSTDESEEKHTKKQEMAGKKMVDKNYTQALGKKMPDKNEYTDTSTDDESGEKQPKKEDKKI